MLSQLEGVDLELYQNTVLPRILEQVVNCKDDIAQPYLMDAVIQVRSSPFARACSRFCYARVCGDARHHASHAKLTRYAHTCTHNVQVFPDEFHLQTLETLLAVCPQLQPNVKVGGVLAGLMTRLAKYAADVPEVCCTCANTPRCRTRSLA